MRAEAEEEIVGALAHKLLQESHASGPDNPLESTEMRAGLGAKEDRKHEALEKIKQGTAGLDDVLVVFEEEMAGPSPG